MVRAGSKPSSVFHGHSSKVCCYHQTLAVLTRSAIPIRHRRYGIRRGPSQSGTYSTLLKTGFSKLVMSPSQLVSPYLTFSPLPSEIFLFVSRGGFPFCGTFLGVIPTPYYGAPCPLELGLSSPFPYVQGAAILLL